jgi:hypothetical protein
MLDGVIDNSAEFESVIPGSPDSDRGGSGVNYVGFSLSGKVTVCATGEQGSSPGVNQESRCARNIKR